MYEPNTIIQDVFSNFGIIKEVHSVNEIPVYKVRFYTRRDVKTLRIDHKDLEKYYTKVL